MSTKKKLLEAAAGNAGGPVYVDDVFSTYVYEGTNATQAVANGIDLAGEGGLVWTKSRTSDPTEVDHQLMDSTSGYSKILESNTTNAVFDFGGAMVTPTSTGFNLSSASRVNQSGNPYVSWTFRKQEGFFDIVTYTGDGTSNRNISHNLGSTPGCILIKNLSLTTAWVVYHRSLGGPTYYLELNTTGSRQSDADQFSSTAPTSSVFTVGPNSGVNRSGDSYVAYLFAHDAQEFGTDEDEAIIKCGSYTGNGSATGPTIDLGFEPQWIMWKKTDSGTESWKMRDTMRGMTISTVATGEDMQADNTSINVATNEGPIPTANGFKLVGTNTNGNASGGTYIYMAIRRPHKPAEEFAATDLYATAPQQAKVAGSLGGFRAGFVADFALKFEQTGVHNHDISCRLAAGQVMYTDATNAESSSSVAKYDFQDGMGDESSASTNNLRMLLRRTPGFFDAVAYSGTGSAQTVSHNLGVAPEMVWVKSRNNTTSSWSVTSSVLGAGGYMFLTNTSLAQGAGSNTDYDNNTSPTSTVFSRGSEDSQGGTNYIAYLFASVAGISKVGSYTGTGSDLNVDCGFSAGARFVLIKRTDSSGDWYVWDSYRGIVAGNDPYLLLNSSAAQVTNTDYIDPLASGFTVTSSAPAALNASSGTYLFYAIA